MTARPAFQAFLDTKEIAAWLGTISREKTKATYSSSLFRYWRGFLAERYSTIWDWVDSVKRAQRSEENIVRICWALELQRYMNSFISQVTKNSMGYSEKVILTSAVKNFLALWVGERDIIYDFKLDYANEFFLKR